MKLSTRLFSKLFIGTGLVISGILSLGVQPSRADFAPNNDQIWAFELANGQRINLPASQRSTSGRFYSWPADSSGDQNFILSSDGNGWNIRHTPSGFIMGSPTTSPATNGTTQLVPMTGGYNTGQAFDFVDTGAGNNTFNIRFRANPTFCVNVPFGQQNKILNLWPCSSTDPTQVFKATYLGGNPTYVAPMANGSTGFLESAAGARISMPNTAAGAALPLVGPNDSDPAQKFTFNTNGYAYSFFRTGTSSGISAANLNFIGLNGGAMGANAYPGAGGRYAGMNFVDLGSGWYQIKHFFYPQYCLSAGQNGNPNQVAMYVPCASTDLRQKWKTTSAITQTTEYEFWIIARQTGNGQLLYWNGSLDVGHVTSAVIPVIKTKNNGVLINSEYVKDSNQITTYSYWPDASTPGLPNPCARQNCANDKNLVIDVLNKGTISGTSDNGAKFAIRRLRLAPSSVATLNTKAYSATNCTSYLVCTCVDEATRLWSFATGENAFIPSSSGITSGSPNYVYNKIMDANNAVNSNGYALNGQYTIIQ